MKKFKCQTATGLTPPTYVHGSYEFAEAEARRLCQEHKCAVEILQVVATVKYEEAPVMAMQPIVYKEPINDLQF